MSPPATHYDFGFLAPCPTGGLLIHGDADEMVAEPGVRKLVDKLNTQKGVTIDYRVYEGADHVMGELRRPYRPGDRGLRAQDDGRAGRCRSRLTDPALDIPEAAHDLAVITLDPGRLGPGQHRSPLPDLTRAEKQAARASRLFYEAACLFLGL